MTQEKPIWKSKKFVIMMATVLYAIIMSLLQPASDLIGIKITPEQADAIADSLPLVLVLGGLWMTGHTLIDALAIAQIEAPKIRNEWDPPVVTGRGYRTDNFMAPSPDYKPVSTKDFDPAAYTPPKPAEGDSSGVSG